MGENKKLKDLWKFKGMGKEVTNCDDGELGEWSLGVTFRDKIFKEQLEVDFPGEYPLGSSFEVIGFEELKAYLRTELNKVLQ